jgi:RHS repeat-associated protein
MNGAVAMVYDGDGNRVSKSVRGTVTEYLVDDLNPTGYPQVVEELAGAVVKRTYVYGHRLISQRESASDGGAVRFHGYDGHGNVRFLTDSQGAITDRYEYDSFGNLLHRSGTSSNSRLYAGEEWDEDLGLIYLRARYYRPGIGRFLTMDPLDGDIRDPLSLHKYLYARSSPTLFIDPDGRMAIPTVMMIVRAVIIGLIGGALVLAGRAVWQDGLKYAAGRELDEDQLLDLREALRIVRECDPQAGAILSLARFQVADIDEGLNETIGIFNVILCDEAFFKLSSRGERNWDSETLEDSREQAVTLFHESWHLRSPRGLRTIYGEHDSYYHEWVDKIRFGWTHDQYGDARSAGQSGHWSAAKIGCANHAPELVRPGWKGRIDPPDTHMYRLDW